MNHRLWRVCALCCLLAAGLADPIQAADSAKNAAIAAGCAPEEARMQLDAAARAHMERVARTLRPNEANKEVTRQGSGFVAAYLVADAGQMTAELVGDAARGSACVGSVLYVVHEYRCVGATPQEALNGPFQKVKSRRIRELTHYADGRWRL